MSGTYSFEIDDARHLATINIAGFFSPEEVIEFEQARDAAFNRLTSLPNQHVTLVDMRGMQIQPQQAVAGFAKVLGAPRWQSRKLAFVVAASLARLQIERAATGRNARLFTSIEEATAWLLEDGADTSKAAPLSHQPRAVGDQGKRRSADQRADLSWHSDRPGP